MNRFLLSMLLVACAPWLCAHNRSFALDQGQIVLGVSPGGGGGTDIFSNFHYNTSGVIDHVTVETGAAQSSATWSGDSLSLEYGVTDTLALGLKSSGIQALVVGLRDRHWSTNLAGWVSFDWGRAWLNLPNWGLVLNETVQAEPVFDNHIYNPEGLINILSSLSFSWRMVDNEWFSLAAFSDWGWMVSVPNPYLDYSWNSPENIRKTLTEKWGLNISPDATIKLAPYTDKLVVEVGAEARFFRKASMVLGLATPLNNFVEDPLAPVNYWMGSIDFKYQF